MTHDVILKVRKKAYLRKTIFHHRLIAINKLFGYDGHAERCRDTLIAQQRAAMDKVMRK